MTQTKTHWSQNSLFTWTNLATKWILDFIFKKREHFRVNSDRGAPVDSIFVGGCSFFGPDSSCMPTHSWSSGGETKHTCCCALLLLPLSRRKEAGKSLTPFACSTPPCVCVCVWTGEKRWDLYSVPAWVYVVEKPARPLRAQRGGALGAWVCEVRTKKKHTDTH